MRVSARQTGRRIALAIMCAPLCAAPGLASDIVAPRQESLEALDAAFEAADSAAAPELNAEDRALLTNALSFDVFSLSTGLAKPLRLPGPIATKPGALDMARTDRPDGGSTVHVKKPLAPAWADWDAKVGADLGLAATAPDNYGPYDPSRMSRNGNGSGTAWVSVGVPQFATVDAHVDPAKEAGRLGTTLTRALPLSSKVSVTLQSSYSLTETYGQPQTSPSNAPSMTPPARTAADPALHVWGNSNAAKFNILPTGTTLAAGVSSSSIDPVMHNTLSAEQILYGPLRVTTAVTDWGQAGESKSVSARFKLNW